MSSLDEYAADIIGADSVPPRHTPLRRIAAHSYSSKAARWLVGVGLVLGVPTAIFFLVVDVVDGEQWLRVGLVVFAIAFTVLLAGAPAIGALRLWSALRSGIVVDGEVVSARWDPPSLRPATIDAADHGFAEGRRRVFHPVGSFEQSFESDSRWARDLTPGTTVRLLADSRAARVRFDLGPSEVSSQDGRYTRGDGRGDAPGVTVRTPG